MLGEGQGFLFLLYIDVFLSYLSRYATYPHCLLPQGNFDFPLCQHLQP